MKLKKMGIKTRTENLERYLAEIRHIETLTAEDEFATAQKIRQGCSASFEKLINANLRFVVSVAKQYQEHGLCMTDLINAGNVGLIRAVPGFDETRGFKFISYAVWSIRQAITQALAESSRTIHIPAAKFSVYKKRIKETGRMEQDFERILSDHDINELLEIPQDEEYVSVSQALGKRESLNEHFKISENSGMLSDILADETARPTDYLLEKNTLIKNISKILEERLGSREREIIKSYFGIGRMPMKLEDIGTALNLTRERVRQIKEDALEKIRHDDVAIVQLKPYR